MILIKLGGSVITDKSQYRTFHEKQVARLCKEIAESGEKVIVVHGAGSFGHVVAKKYALQNGFSDSEQIPAVAQVQYDVRELSSMVVRELMKAGIPAVSVPPGSCFVMDSGRLVVNDSEAVRSLEDLGIMPVLFGDVVMDRKKGFGICSGDQIMEVLANMFEPSRIIFVSDIDGLYDRDPKTCGDAELITDVTEDVMKKISAGSTVDDVTGGVRGKMESMLRMCSGDRDCILVNGTVPGRLLALLRGENVPCTKARM